MKAKYILLSVCLASALSGCSDYLDVEKDLKDRMTLDEVFTSKDYTEEWLAAAYRYIYNYNADMGYGGEWPFGFADDIYHPTYKEFVEKRYSESTYQTSYGYCYQGIRQASTFIQNVDKCEMISLEERADLKAQARFVRAFYYWKLLQKYGPIPLVPEDEGQDYTKPYEELYLARNTYDECVDYISREMVELLTPKGVQAEVEIVYQTLGGLHESCPNHPGDWYFSGDYPTRGGVRLVNRAFIDYMEQEETEYIQ